MNKLKMESLDMTKANRDKIAQMFPQVVTEVADPSGAQDAEGKPLLKKAIDFEKLKVLLSAGTGDYAVVDDERERYEFTWVGKRQAMIDAATPIRKTLRPCPEESKDWATTENLYIEGDNLEVLKLLQESYLGKVKMIYIDPPYNTGKDFIYKDNFTQSREKYEEELEMFDEEGHRLFQNTETNGRFHSDWCSMIYARLQLARNLLSDDGVIFISIDDNEVSNLKNICDEVFGENNFVACLPTVMNLKGNNDEFGFAGTHEYTLVFVKSKMHIVGLYGLDLSDEDIKDYNLQDEIGKYKLGATLMRTGEAGGRDQRPKGYYPIFVSSDLKSMSIFRTNDDDIEVYPKTKQGKEMSWRRSPETLSNSMKEFVITGNINSISFYKKQRLAEDMLKGKKPKSLFYKPQYSSGNGTEEMKSLFDNRVFDNPKPLLLIKDIIKIGSAVGDIVMDFFSGSATTAHAVMQLNAEDGGNRKFIMVQLPEVCDTKSEAAKAGYKTICEIGKERIRRAGAKIVAEQKAKNDGGLFADESKPLDTGFRVFKLDTTNMKDVYYGAGDIKQDDVVEALSNIKDGRSDIDLLYGCLLDWGVYEGLQLPHIRETINGCRVHTVDDHRTEAVDLIACFDEMIPEETIRTIASRKPMRAVFRDSSFKDSADKINVSEIFKALSPDTTVKVI